jgi:hypothetical protein
MDIGHTTGPLVAGIVAGYFGFSYAFIAAGGLLVVIALCFLFFMGKQTLSFGKKDAKAFGICNR